MIDCDNDGPRPTKVAAGSNRRAVVLYGHPAANAAAPRRQPVRGARGLGRPGRRDIQLLATLALVLASALSARAPTHSGTGEASTAAALDQDFMFVGDDETQLLRLYFRRFDGGPLWQQDFTANLGLHDRDAQGLPREVDIEASTRIGNRIYWLGSHGNCSDCTPPGELRPNRDRLFATDIVGSGANARLQYVGRYDGLRRDLIAWDNTNGHGLGTRYLRLQASAAAGVPPETVARDGFNLEGLCTSPDGSVAYLGFRAPLTPNSGRSNALIIPLLNMPQLVRDNPSLGPAQFGPPLQFFLDGRGVRSMDSGPNGVIIVAGPTTNTGASHIYSWSGRTNDPACERLVNITVPRPEGLIADGAYADGTLIQLVSEGATDFRSEFVLLGPAIPRITRGEMLGRDRFRLSLLGRAGGLYDVEASAPGGGWLFLQQVLMPATNQVLWTNDNLPPGAPERFYRLRYPSSR